MGKSSGKNGDKKSSKRGEADNANGHAPRLSKSDYLERLAPMQVELNAMANWLQHHGKRLLVIVEGRDTAGKGGAIHAISETLNPRQCHTVALDKPSERETGQWYFQRYVPHLPSAGEIALFDRSWYNRAGVEAVMGFCTPQQTQAFLKQVPIFEKLLVDDGILLFKYWLTVDQAQQEERMADRLSDPLKRWKLSPIDLEARRLYRQYGEARDAMLQATHTRHASWTLVDFNDQRRGRLTLIRDLLDRLPDVTTVPPKLHWPPLDHAPEVEVFNAKLKPIPSL